MPPEPTMAIPKVFWATMGRATCPRRILKGADVVLFVVARIVRSESIGVCDEVLYNVTIVLHLLMVVLGRHDPVVVDEGVSDLLRPALHERKPAVVVVAQRGKPWLVGEPTVHRAPTGLEVPSGHSPCARWLGIATLSDTLPIEVVANIQNVLRALVPGQALHGSRNLPLCIGNVTPGLPPCCLVARQKRTPIANCEHMGVVIFGVTDFRVPPLVLIAVVRVRCAGHRQRRIVLLEGVDVRIQSVWAASLLLHPTPSDNANKTCCQGCRGSQHVGKTPPEPGQVAWPKVE
mmetsp:Transcript_3266/g.7852  ORF Transcript_3266/g.7852 Transcript_3266/m.7852 type:complete len:290 (-) Transcript_3266:87-956(-)